MSASRHCFTSRYGGVSEGIYKSFNLRINSDDSPENLRENYRRLEAQMKCSRYVLANQKHTDIVLEVDGSFAKRDLFDKIDYVADGLITREPELMLVVFSADCVPILLEGDGVVAAVHAGWRGTAQCIVQKAVRSMNCEPRSIRAWIGPAIGGCCYQVGDEVRAAMLQSMGKCAESAFVEDRVDLKRLNGLQLEACGVERIEVSGECTFCKPQKYWSHRYTNGQRGTQAAAIVLEA